MGGGILALIKLLGGLFSMIRKQLLIAEIRKDISNETEIKQFKSEKDLATKLDSASKSGGVEWMRGYAYTDDSALPPDPNSDSNASQIARKASSSES